MLSYSLLKNHAGIMLIADYSSLRWVHDTVHAVNERSILVKDKEGSFLGLAYDVRKAYERQREILPPPAHYEEVGIRYGVKILWPVILLQQRMMRVSLGFFDHSRRDQAVCYALEAILDEAIREDFGVLAQDVLTEWQRIDPANPGVFDRLDGRGAIFCSWKKAQRKAQFAKLLGSFNPLYDDFYSIRVRNGERGLVPPEEFAKWEQYEWPDPNW